MNRGLLFLIVCIVVGGLFLLLAYEWSRHLPAKGSAGGGVAQTGNADGAGDGVAVTPPLNVPANAPANAPTNAAASNAGGVSPSQLSEQDQQAEKDINAPDALEAREWCKPERKSMGFEVSKNEMAKWTEELYALGARKVVVVGISKIQDVEIAASMVVVLPDDKAQRQKLIDWENKLFENEPDELIKDTGQKYMYLTFD